MDFLFSSPPLSSPLFSSFLFSSLLFFFRLFYLFLFFSLLFSSPLLLSPLLFFLFSPFLFSPLLFFLFSSLGSSPVDARSVTTWQSFTSGSPMMWFLWKKTRRHQGGRTGKRRRRGRASRGQPPGRQKLRPRLRLRLRLRLELLGLGGASLRASVFRSCFQVDWPEKFKETQSEFRASELPGRRPGPYCYGTPGRAPLFRALLLGPARAARPCTRPAPS
jgi:hypothetical protein